MPVCTMEMEILSLRTLTNRRGTVSETVERRTSTFLGRDNPIWPRSIFPTLVQHLSSSIMFSTGYGSGSGHPQVLLTCVIEWGSTCRACGGSAEVQCMDAPVTAAVALCSTEPYPGRVARWLGVSTKSAAFCFADTLRYDSPPSSVLHDVTSA